MDAPAETHGHTTSRPSGANAGLIDTTVSARLKGTVRTTRPEAASISCRLLPVLLGCRYEMHEAIARPVECHSRPHSRVDLQREERAACRGIPHPNGPGTGS